MGYKVLLKKNTDIMSFVNDISDFSMINNLIYDLINRDGVANFFCNNDGSYSFSLITDRREKVYILFRNDMIFISNNLFNIRQNIVFKKGDSYVSLKNSTYSKVDISNYFENISMESESIYDNDYNLIYNRIVRNNCLSSDDIEINEKISYDNYVVTYNDYRIGDSIVRTSFIEYVCNSELNERRYYVSSDGSGFKLISEDEFLDNYSDYIYNYEDSYVKTIKK